MCYATNAHGVHVFVTRTSLDDDKLAHKVDTFNQFVDDNSEVFRNAMRLVVCLQRFSDIKEISVQCEQTCPITLSNILIQTTTLMCVFSQTIRFISFSLYSLKATFVHCIFLHTRQHLKIIKWDES